jgi:hypothetical protein
MPTSAIYLPLNSIPARGQFAVVNSPKIDSRLQGVQVWKGAFPDLRKILAWRRP